MEARVASAEPISACCSGSRAPASHSQATTVVSVTLRNRCLLSIFYGNPYTDASRRRVGNANRWLAEHGRAADDDLDRETEIAQRFRLLTGTAETVVERFDAHQRGEGGPVDRGHPAGGHHLGNGDLGSGL